MPSLQQSRIPGNFKPQNTLTAAICNAAAPPADPAAILHAQQSPLLLLQTPVLLLQQLLLSCVQSLPLLLLQTPMLLLLLQLLLQQLLRMLRLQLRQVIEAAASLMPMARDLGGGARAKGAAGRAVPGSACSCCERLIPFWAAGLVPECQAPGGACRDKGGCKGG